MFFMALENSLIYFPAKYPEGDWSASSLAPRDCEFTSEDGTKLHAWYVEAENPTAYILFCHGNAGNLSHRTQTLHDLRDIAGATVLIFDYRGYGKSEGSPNEQGVLADARAARTELAKLAAIDESEIVLMGRSLGGAVAVDLAQDGARGLVLESTFSSLPDAAAFHYPWLPVRWLMRTRLNSAKKIEKYDGPILFSHGDRDTIIPIELGLKLHEASGRDASSFKTHKGFGHNDGMPRDYYNQLRQWLEQLR